MRKAPMNAREQKRKHFSRQSPTCMVFRQVWFHTGLRWVYHAIMNEENVNMEIEFINKIASGQTQSCAHERKEENR